MRDTVETRTQFISYNNPGITGYSQKGSIGDTGERGSQIYFTPYVGNDASCIEKIKNGKELSNNPNYNSESITYYDNDMVLDINGDLWKIVIIYSLLPEESGKITAVNMIKQNNILSYFTSTNTASFISSFNVNNDTDSTLHTIHSYAQPKQNDISVSVTTVNSLYQYYRDILKPYSYGNWYKMTVDFINSAIISDSYSFKFVIVLPNGITVEKVSNSRSNWIFIDNRLLYGIRSAVDSSNYTDLKTAISYQSGINNNENTYNTVTKFADMISKYGKAYVEIMDKNSGLVYRVYANISNERP